MFQVYTDMKATSLKAIATIPYPLHFVLQNIMKEFRRYFIDNVFTLVRLFPVSTSKLLSDQTLTDLWLRQSIFPSIIFYLTSSPPATYSKYSPDVQLYILHSFMLQMLQSQSSSSHREFAVQVSERFWCCLS